MILYWLIRGLGFLLQRLPISIGYQLADLTADATFVLWRRGRGNMIANMGRVLGKNAADEPVRTAARKALRNYIRYLVEFLRLPTMSSEYIESVVLFDSWEPLNLARSRGKGAVYAGMHMGNWDIGGAIIRAHGYEISVVVDTFSNPRLNRLVQGSRARWGTHIIPFEGAGLRALRALRRNHALGLLMDRPVPIDQGVAVEFFGAPTVVPAGAATLALRTGASVVPMTMVREPDNTFHALVGECILFEPTGDDQEDVRALTQQIMDTFAVWVRQYPDQWYMFRRMWPESTPD